MGSGGGNGERAQRARKQGNGRAAAEHEGCVGEASLFLIYPAAGNTAYARADSTDLARKNNNSQLTIDISSCCPLLASPSCKSVQVR